VCTSEKLAEPVCPNRALALPPLVQARGLITARAPPAQAEAEVLYEGGRVIKPHPVDRANCPGLHGLVASFAEGAGLRCDRCAEEVRAARAGLPQSAAGLRPLALVAGQRGVPAAADQRVGLHTPCVSPNISLGEPAPAALRRGR
jgi:hypothetical protein